MTITQPGQLTVGAAKVDITPSEDAMPSGRKAVHAPIHARAVVVNNGQTKVALLGLDVVALTQDFVEELVEQSLQELSTRIKTGSVRRGASSTPRWICMEQSLAG